MAVRWCRPHRTLPRRHAPGCKKIVTLAEFVFGGDSTTMGRSFQPLLFLLACCTESQLRRQIEFFKAENQTLLCWSTDLFERVVRKKRQV
jgi:hypothetical protein